MQTALLHVSYPHLAAYYDDWREAFEAASEFATQSFNIFTEEGRRAAAGAIEKVDLVVCLHSTNSDTLEYIRPLEAALAGRRGRVVAFVGNEFNQPWAGLAEKRAHLARISADVVATQLLEEAGRWLYEDVAKRVISLPHALNPKVFQAKRDYAARRVDVGGRSFRYPVFLGDQERNRLYDFFQNTIVTSQLSVDLAQNRRFNRADWADFLDNCRSTVSSEAGSWYVEKEDTTAVAIRDYLRGQTRLPVMSADSPLRHLIRKLPTGLKLRLSNLLRRGPIKHDLFLFEKADEADIFRRFFAGKPRAPAYTKCIAARHFDAAGTKTLQVMLPGRYNDILRPGAHYVELKPDFSNLQDVIDAIRDPALARPLIETAYALMHDSHTYRSRMSALAAFLNG